VAIGVMRALREAGVEIPRDAAVIGFDDIDDAATHQPSLSTVAQSFELIGSLAGECAVDALRGRPAEPGYHYATTSLVLRQSCGCSGTKDRGAPAPSATADVRERFVADLLDAVSDDGALTPARLAEQSALGHRVVDLFETVAGAPTFDVAASVGSLATEAYQVAPRERSVTRVVELLRGLARNLVAERRADAGAAAGLDDVAHKLAIAVVENQMRARLANYLQFQTQRGQYEINTGLLRRHNRESRSLTWLAGTEVRAGCLAVWDAEPDQRAGSSAVTVVGSYDDSGSYDASGVHCEVRSFPPAPLLDLIDAHPGDLLYLLSVRFDGSDWGFLALVGSVELRAQTALEMFNQWAILLTVSMDHEQAVRSVVSQREDLSTAYDREHTLVEQIRASEERYALAAEAANDGLWDWDLAAATVYYSARWKSLLGYAEDEVGAAPEDWLQRVHPDDQAGLDQVLARQFDGRSATMELEHRMRDGDGEYRWMLIRARSVCDLDGRVVRLVGSMSDVTERRLLQDQLRRDALYDALTGLPNRTLFLDRLNRAIELANRRSDYWFAVLFLDLDGFKIINDSLGHQSGDDVLVQVADRLSLQMRTNDTAARFGGDEFAVLLNDVRAVSDLPATVDRILATLAAPMALGAETVSVNASVGIAVSMTDYANAEDFLRDADTAMYRAKGLGNGASVLFHASMHTEAMDRLRLESDLREAVAGDQFELHYQPILRLDPPRPVGVEALIRWNHPTRGMLSPAEFLPVAESTGLILAMGRWTIREACRQIRAWRDEFGDRPDFTVALNLSNRQFWDPALIPHLRLALADHGVPPSALVFEMTEGVIMHNPQAAGNLMRELHDESFALHVDDFGTGYSSLEALHKFPIDALKIDRSFVARMTVDPRSRELVRIMIAMGRNLGVVVIAEGIETDQQAQMLTEMGCPLVQGYLYCPPVPADRLRSLLHAAALT
jgi:diguanylate cyclase (GGDEF)-like protein/PAS domain S-box-containing protein